ncbi:MAG: hypothetical protein Q4A82_07110 [Corynebacterium sp.]|nr:hypothetical protein [Corynebacterium sp.]
MKHTKEWDHTSWLALLSFLIAIFVFALPFLFPGAFRRNFEANLLAAVPLGALAAVMAYTVRSWKLMIFALLAALSPVIDVFLLLFAIPFIYHATNGAFPPDEWLRILGVM